MTAIPDDGTMALTGNELEQHVRNGTPADWLFVKRLVLTCQLQLQVERAAALLCHYQPGIYDNIERALNNLRSRRPTNGDQG